MLLSDVLFVGCDAGYYCSGTGKTSVTDKCNAGYYCVKNASVPNPRDSTGDICPVGTYCPRGTDRPLFCENGTYANVTGRIELLASGVFKRHIR